MFAEEPAPQCTFEKCSFYWDFFGFWYRCLVHPWMWMWFEDRFSLVWISVCCDCQLPLSREFTWTNKLAFEFGSYLEKKNIQIAHYSYWSWFVCVHMINDQAKMDIHLWSELFVGSHSSQTNDCWRAAKLFKYLSKIHIDFK